MHGCTLVFDNGSSNEEDCNPADIVALHNGYEMLGVCFEF